MGKNGDKEKAIWSNLNRGGFGTQSFGQQEALRVQNMHFNGVGHSDTLSDFILKDSIKNLFSRQYIFRCIVAHFGVTL